MPRLRKSAMGESARIPGENGSLSRREYQRAACWRTCRPGCADLPWEKVPGFRGKKVHFLGGNTRGQPAGGPVPRLRGPAMGESARIPQETGSLSRRECRRIAAWRACRPGCADPPGGDKGAEGKGNAATDAVADMAWELTFRRWESFAGKLHTCRRWKRSGEGGWLLGGYLKLMSKRPTHSPWAPAWTTTTSRPTRFL